jgi:hypothetical protein
LQQIANHAPVNKAWNPRIAKQTVGENQKTCTPDFAKRTASGLGSARQNLKAREKVKSVNFTRKCVKPTQIDSLTFGFPLFLA